MTRLSTLSRMGRIRSVTHLRPKSATVLGYRVERKKQKETERKRDRTVRTNNLNLRAPNNIKSPRAYDFFKCLLIPNCEERRDIRC